MKKNINWKLYLGTFIVIILWLLSFPIIKYFLNGNDWSKIGIIGDSFGAINSLFSGLAFVGLIFTIYLQKNELRLQREELKLQRNELKENREQLRRSAEAQEKSEILLKKQILLESHIAKINAIKAIIDSNNNDLSRGPTYIHLDTVEINRNKYLVYLEDQVDEINNIIVKL